MFILEKEIPAIVVNSKHHNKKEFLDMFGRKEPSPYDLKKTTES